jgi:hypothetical protein
MLLEIVRGVTLRSGRVCVWLPASETFQQGLGGRNSLHRVG